MTIWIDPIRPNHFVVSYEVVASTAGISPHRPPRRTFQGDRLPIEIDVPSTGMERQHCEIATTTRTAQVNGSMLMAYPNLAGFDCIELG